MMAADVFLAEDAAEPVRNPLSQPPRVDEDQSAAVRVDQLDNQITDLGPLLVRADGREFRRRNDDFQVEGPRVSNVDNPAQPLPGARSEGTDSREEIGNSLDRLLRCRQADPLQWFPDVFFQPLQRQRQMRAAFVSDERVNFVDDHRVDSLQRLAASFGREQQVQGLGRRDQDVRRFPDEGRSLRGRCVSGAESDSKLRDGDSGELFCSEGVQLFEGNRKVAVHVIRKSPQWRDVDNPHSLLCKLPFNGLFQKPIDDREEGGQCFSAAGGSGDERVLAGGDVRPPERLWLGRSLKPVEKPAFDQRMKTEKRHEKRVQSLQARLRLTKSTNKKPESDHRNRFRQAEPDLLPRTFPMSRLQSRSAANRFR